MTITVNWLRMHPTPTMAACPNRANHAEGPDGYLHWHTWAEQVYKTHTFTRCPDCGLWTIATPKNRQA